MGRNVLICCDGTNNEFGPENTRFKRSCRKCSPLPLTKRNFGRKMLSSILQACFMMDHERSVADPAVDSMVCVSLHPTRHVPRDCELAFRESLRKCADVATIFETETPHMTSDALDRGDELVNESEKIWEQYVLLNRTLIQRLHQGHCLALSTALDGMAHELQCLINESRKIRSHSAKKLPPHDPVS
jgi:hypothetical protein